MTVTTSRRKTIQDHITLARRLLKDSEREFDAGDEHQGCEKLWGAASQSLMAVAKQRRWRSGKSNNRADVVERLSEELQEPSLDGDFGVVEKVHANFYHDFMEEPELIRTRRIANRFVLRVLDIVESGQRTESDNG